jgi:hypothetical protein
VRVHFLKEDGVTDLSVASASEINIILNDEDGVATVFNTGTTPPVEFDDEVGDGTGTDGRVRVKLLEATLSKKSIYRVQGHVIFTANTDEYRTEVGRFRVNANLAVV